MPDALKRIGQSALEAQRRWMAGSNPRQRWWIGMSLLGMLSVTGALAWLSTRADWRLLYTDMDPRAAQEAAGELAAEKIPYQLDSTGTTLRVPADLVDKARLGLAAKGLPQSGRIGFELFDKPNWVGSEFDEQVNYQRAMEGELERTIGGMDAVQSASVHLVLPHDSLFQGDQRPAKASVVLKLARRGLSDQQAEAIRTLVASAVDGLDPNNVTLVDADGQSFFGEKDAQTEEAVYEQQLTDRLLATLEPIAGRDNIRASVSVDFDSSSQDDTQETYDPSGAVPTSTQRSQETSGGGQAAPAGIPGTASNAPNGGGASNASVSGSGVNSFAALGITVNDDGTLTLNTDTLNSALNEDYPSVVNFFQGVTSIGEQFSNTLSSLSSSSPTGVLDQALQQDSSEESTLNANISNENQIISNEQTQVTAELNQANEALQQIPSELSEVNEIYSAITGYNEVQQ